MHTNQKTLAIAKHTTQAYLTIVDHFTPFFGMEESESNTSSQWGKIIFASVVLSASESNYYIGHQNN
jgi:hypothetical protein